ncbi:MAG TPA: S8 family serine peptidase [Rugosimonospora sp.]
MRSPYRRPGYGSAAPARPPGNNETTIRSAGLRLAAASAVIAATAVVGLVAPSAAQAAPSVKPNPRQWYLTDGWHVEKDVWPVSQGEGATVAVIDTGVGGGRYTPPEMTGDFILPGTDLHQVGGDAAYDDQGHGTEMAEFIAARGTNGGYAGLAPKAKILPIRVISGVDIAKGIRYAVDHGAKVINISMAGIEMDGVCSDVEQGAVDYAVAHDVIIVAGAGNSGNGDNNPEAPAACPGVTAVGAVDQSGKPWVKTQRQPYVTVAAPGVEMPIKNQYNEPMVTTGTSNSTALVSATMALVRAKFPTLSAREVVQRVVATADDAGPPGNDDTTGYGVVNPARALTAVDVAKNAPNPTFQRHDALLAERKHAADSKKRNSLLLKAGAVACPVLVLLAVALLIVWSVRRDRKAKSAAATGMLSRGPGQPYAPQAPAQQPYVSPPQPGPTLPYPPASWQPYPPASHPGPPQTYPPGAAPLPRPVPPQQGPARTHAPNKEPS